MTIRPPPLKNSFAPPVHDELQHDRISKINTINQHNKIIIIARLDKAAKAACQQRSSSYQGMRVISEVFMYY